MNEYNRSPSEAEADYVSLRTDTNAVGAGLREAIARLREEVGQAVTENAK